MAENSVLGEALGASDDEGGPREEDTRSGSRAEAGENPEHQDDDADLAQDYSKFAALLGNAKSKKKQKKAKQISAQTIRRGEKDFEEHGTQAQQAALESSRAALETVLAHTRVHGLGGSESLRGWYFPDMWAEDGDEDGDEKIPRTRRFAHTCHRVVMVEAERGLMFASVGVVPGRTWVPGLAKDAQPAPRPGFDRTWLLPEEALFLVERGSMELRWPLRSVEEIVARTDADAAEQRDVDEDGIPLSLEAAYALLIAGAAADDEGRLYRGRVTLPFYQVYTHLRRAGYQVLRAVGTADRAEPERAPPTVWQWLVSLLAAPNLTRTSPSSVLPLVATPPPYGPLVRPGLYRGYRDVYAQLQLFPAARPLRAPTTADSPFHVDMHVWKSSSTTPFSKTRPPPPDFYLAVADAHDTAVPTLAQMEGLLGAVPRPTEPTQPTQRKPLSGGLGPVYRRLKQDHGGVLLAVVDHGLVNYMRFSDGPFAEEPLWPRFDGMLANRGVRGPYRGKGGKNKKRPNAARPNAGAVP